MLRQNILHVTQSFTRVAVRNIHWTCASPAEPIIPKLNPTQTPSSKSKSMDRSKFGCIPPHHIPWQAYPWPPKTSFKPTTSEQITSLIISTDAAHPYNSWSSRQTPPLGWKDFPGYNHSNHSHRRRLKIWLEDGKPTFENYKLSFGKFKGRRLEEVPRDYVVDYLIPKRKVVARMYDSEAEFAIEEFMRGNPDWEGWGAGGKVKGEVGKRKVGH